MKPVLYFLALFLLLMGAIGGIGCTLYCHSVPCTLGVIILIVFAYPEAKRIFQKLIE